MARLHRQLTTLALAALALVLLATPARAAGKPDAPPPDLLVTVALGPASALRPLQQYADAVQPGAGAIINEQMIRSGLAQAVGATALNGVDSAAWIYVVVGHIDGTPALGVVAKLTDPKAFAAGGAPTLLKGGWGVIGSKPLLDKLGGYLLAALPGQATPRVPTATIYLPQLLSHFRPQVDAFKAQMTQLSAAEPSSGRLVQGYIDGFGTLADDTDRIIVTIESTAQLAWLDLGLVPRASSRLAKFAALQRASDYALLERLPTGDASMVFAGHLELGPYRDGLLGLMASFWGQQATADVTAQIAAVAKALTGDIGTTIRITPGKGMSFTQLFGTADTVAADKALVALLDLFRAGRTMTFGKASTTIRSTAGTTQAHGVALRSYETTQDLSKMTPAERQALTALQPTGSQRSYVGTFDKLTMFVASQDSLDEAGRAIDAARGKGAHYTPSPAIATLLDAARAHKDSIAAVIDVAPFLAFAGIKGSDLTFLFSLGAADKNVHFRFAVPSASIASVIKAAKP